MISVKCISPFHVLLRISVLISERHQTNPHHLRVFRLSLTDSETAPLTVGYLTVKSRRRTTSMNFRLAFLDPQVPLVGTSSTEVTALAAL